MPNALALHTTSTLSAPLRIARPSWTFEIGTFGVECFDASLAHSAEGGVQNNTRWTHWAVPPGKPPPTGWPIIVTFEVMGFWPLVGDNVTCGDGWHPHYGPNPPPPSPSCESVLLQIKRNCSAAKATGNATLCHRCIYRDENDIYRRGSANISACRSHGWPPSTSFDEELRNFCPPPPAPPGHHHDGHHSSIHPFAKPDDVLRPEFFKNGSWAGTSVDGNGAFDAHAGLLWLQRVRQYTLVNGFAWVILNPYMGDSWDWDTESDWDKGLDQPFLKKLFTSIRSGSFPKNRSTLGALGSAPLLDVHRVVPFGWSAGAQMVSWMIELTSSNRFKEIEVVAGVMLSGGSHKCYLNNPHSNASGTAPWDPPAPTDFVNVAIGSCAGCNSSKACGERAYIGKGSNRTYEAYNQSSASKMRRCSNDFNTVAHPEQPCCQYCCPQNVTEQWYLDHPEDYNKHPPTFLAQMTTLDINADLCAGKNYHDTMLAHGATSHLALVPKADERCFCVGTPGLEHLPSVGTAANGNPFAAEACPIIPPDTHPSQHYDDGLFHCMDHSMGFAAMVEPLTMFLLKALGNHTERKENGRFMAKQVV